MKSSASLNSIAPIASQIIGFWGFIPKNVVELNKKLYPNAIWVDLDINFNYPQVKIIPDASCKIIKNIFDNAFFLKEKIVKILAPIGKDKCDSAFFAAVILKENGFNVETFEFCETAKGVNFYETPICESNLALRQKIELITGNIVEEKPLKLEKCLPRFGFWGVPPNDLSILELFPNNTHVFGWTRCAEAKAPADIELEMHLIENLPTIFYAQTFCAKNELAKYLADKHNGLYIDVDGWATNSTIAKIEAFLCLR